MEKVINVEKVINNLEDKYHSALTKKNYYNSLALKCSDESLKGYYLMEIDRYKTRMKVLDQTILLIEENTK